MNTDNHFFSYNGQEPKLRLEASIVGLNAQVEYLAAVCAHRQATNDRMAEHNAELFENALEQQQAAISLANQVRELTAERDALSRRVADTDELHSRIGALEQEVDAQTAATHEATARWGQRMDETEARHSAETATVSRQLADARTTAARNQASYETARAERDRLQTLLKAADETIVDRETKIAMLESHIRHEQDAIQEDDESPEPITLPGTTRSEQPPGNGTIVSAQPIAIVLPPAGNEPEPELPAGYEKVRGNAYVREDDLIWNRSKWISPKPVVIGRVRASQYPMVARPVAAAGGES